MVVRSVRVAGVGALLAGMVLGGGAIPADAAATTSGPSWVFSGSGFGHGVGMSQYGAKAMADDGKSATQILKYYYRGITVDRVRDDQLVHVNVADSRPSVTLQTSAATSGGGSFTIEVGSRTLEASTSSVVKVVRSGSDVKVSRTNGTRTVRATGPSAEVTFDDGRTLLSINGKSYLSGSARVVPAAGGGVHAVMVVRLHDEYLDNVGEMPWSWPSAALQAQAAAARGYALRKVNKPLRPSCACHVYDDTRDQVFGTYPGAGPNAYWWGRWKTAVRAGGTSTTGLVPRYRGALIEAVYSSSSGGRTQDNEDVWGGSAVPYLRSVDDPYSMRPENPRRSWSTSVPEEKVAAAFGLTDVLEMDITRRTTGGGVAQVVAISSTGERASMTGEQMRRGLGLSSSYVASIEAPRPFPDVTPETTAFTTEIAWLKDQGITTGYADGTFGPKDNISREAMAAFLYRAAGRPAVQSAPDFTDVNSSSTFAKEIAWLQDQGITTGYADGSFGPKRRITREAMAAFMTRYLLDGRVPDATSFRFGDVAGTQFEDHIAWIADQGLTTGYANGTFGPKRKITREAMAAFLYRARDML